MQSVIYHIEMVSPEIHDQPISSVHLVTHSHFHFFYASAKSIFASQQTSVLKALSKKSEYVVNMILRTLNFLLPASKVILLCLESLKN